MNAKSRTCCWAALLFVAAFAIACSEDAGSTAGLAADARVSASAQAQPQAVGAPTEPSDSARKLIQNAGLQLVVESCADARQAIEAELDRLGGFLSNAHVDHSEGQVSRSVLVVRVPAGELRAMLAACSKLGTVVRETLESEDITEQSHDLAARLTNARMLEGRLHELLATRGKDVADLLEVERELARVRETIERIEGKLRLWQSQVAMSTLELELNTRDVRALVEPVAFGTQLGTTVSHSWRSMGTAGRALLLVLAALLPWAVPLLVFGFLATRLRRVLVRRAESA